MPDADISTSVDIIKLQKQIGTVNGSQGGPILINQEGMSSPMLLRFRPPGKMLTHDWWPISNKERMLQKKNDMIPYTWKAVIPAKIGNMPTLRTTEINLKENKEALEINLDLLEERREQAAVREAKNQSKDGKLVKDACKKYWDNGSKTWKSSWSSPSDTPGFPNYVVFAIRASGIASVLPIAGTQRLVNHCPKAGPISGQMLCWLLWLCGSGSGCFLGGMAVIKHEPKQSLSLAGASLAGASLAGASLVSPQLVGGLRPVTEVSSFVSFKRYGLLAGHKGCEQKVPWKATRGLRSSLKLLGKDEKVTGHQQ
ncbi:hypothetical protein Tco_0497935 [Tanacetum coccineum]